MSVLVTGGCGFVARNVLPKLCAAGHERIIVFDNESIGSRSQIDHLPGVEFVHGDLRDTDAVDAAVRSARSVVHLAARTSVIESIEDPIDSFEVNVQGTINLLESMRRNGVDRIVNASTGGAILGDVIPPVSEEMAPHPLSPYGASKLAVEGYLSAYAGSYGIKPVSLRFSNLYGPYSDHKSSVVAAFLGRVQRGDRLPVFGDGEQTRDYLFVSDLADVIVQLLGSDVCGTFQLGSGVPTSLNRLIKLMSGIVGADLSNRIEWCDRRAGEVRHNYCDISKAAQQLGYAPNTSLEVGLDTTWKWFNQQQGNLV